jgi:hypothetical protein
VRILSLSPLKAAALGESMTPKLNEEEEFADWRSWFALAAQCGDQAVGFPIRIRCFALSLYKYFMRILLRRGNEE